MDAATGIRELQPGEEAACAAILTRAWNAAMPSQPRFVNAQQFLVETEGERVFVAHRTSEISGFVSIWMPDAFVHHLYVDPRYQRQGMGAALLANAARIADGMELSLKCQTENENALHFYQTLGFVEAGEQGDGEFGRWVRLKAPGAKA